jgi:hypothetical protein
MRADWPATAEVSINLTSYDLTSYDLIGAGIIECRWPSTAMLNERWVWPPT